MNRSQVGHLSLSPAPVIFVMKVIGRGHTTPGVRIEHGRHGIEESRIFIEGLGHHRVASVCAREALDCGDCLRRPMTAATRVCCGLLQSRVFQGMR